MANSHNRRSNNRSRNHRSGTRRLYHNPGTFSVWSLTGEEFRQSQKAQQGQPLSKGARQVVTMTALRKALNAKKQRKAA